MSYIIELPTFSDTSGNLTVMEKLLPFDIKRFFCIYDVTSTRGRHRHKKTIQALICVGGSCQIYVDNGEEKKTITLDHPSKCLILEPQDWHTMDHFSQNAVLLVFASEHYDRSDYITEAYL